MMVVVQKTRDDGDGWLLSMKIAEEEKIKRNYYIEHPQRRATIVVVT